jgi:hypothetical protein
MAFNFPNAPTTDQLYPQPPIAGLPVYRWDGEKWTVKGASSIPKTPVYTDGSTPMSSPLTLVSPPVNPAHASAKLYVDSAIASIPSPAGSVRYDVAQSLSSTQKTQAQVNINAQATLGFTPQPALGFTPVHQGGGAGQANNNIYIGWASSLGALKAQVDATDLGSLWTSFSAAALISANGYQKFATGIMVQWGTTAGTTDANGNIGIGYPAAFPNGTLIVLGVNGDSIASPGATLSNYKAGYPTASACIFHAQGRSGPLASASLRVDWIAFGY